MEKWELHKEKLGKSIYFRVEKEFDQSVGLDKKISLNGRGNHSHE